MYIKQLHTKKDICLRCLFFILLPITLFSQNYSNNYITIRDNNSLSIDQRSKKIDSLFLDYENRQIFDILYTDIHNYSEWLFENTLDYDKMILYCKKGVLLSKKIEKPNEIILTDLRYRIGYFLQKKEDFENAFIAFNEVTKHSTIEVRVARAYNGMGFCKARLGDYYNAVNYYETAIVKIKAIDDHKFYFSFIINASDNYKQIGTPYYLNRGISLLTEATEAIENNTINKNSIRSDQLISIYNNLANLHAEKKDVNFIEAEKNYKKAIAYSEETGDKKQLGNIYTSLGYLYCTAKKPKALKYLELALKKIDKNPEATSICYSNKALYFSNINDKTNALLNIEKAIKVLVPQPYSNKNTYTENDILTSSYKTELLEALIEKAGLQFKFKSIEISNNDLNSALETLRLADALVDNIRFNSNEDKSKLFWRGISSKIYTNATNICFLLKKPEDAFYFMEKNKAILLLEDVTRQQLKEKANIPDSLDNLHKDLKLQIISCTEAINKSRKLKEKDSLKTNLLQLKESYYKFSNTLKEEYQSFYKNQEQTQILTLKEAQETLSNNNTAYINYILNDVIGYGLVITKKSIDFFEIEDAPKLLEFSTLYRGLLESPFKHKTDIDQFSSVSSKLYSKLFPEFIRQHLKEKKLIIIPDYYLQNIPFEALITSEKNSYLIQEHEVNYAYSITFLAKNNKLKRINDNQFFGLAPIEFNSNLENLPESKYEIETISKLFTSHVFTNKNATSQNFFEQSQNHSIIHLASHANANDSINPWIAYADKKISLNELYLSKNSADLVVLSGCKTSLGKLNKGEGVMSLARGFFNTGSNSVLSSLWNVNDQSSSKIMVDFYKNLKDGKTKSEALRLSKLNYIKSHELSEASPHYWASFVLIGDSNTIPSITKNNHTALFVLGIILLLGLIYFLYRKIKK